MDDEYEDHWVDDVSGYPTMIDPATGLVWGIDPDTGTAFDGVDWPTDGDELLNPVFEEDLSIFGVHPITGEYFGIDPETGEPWHCNIVDSEGVIYNPPWQAVPDCEDH
jgi:hypothetical protein